MAAMISTICAPVASRAPLCLARNSARAAFTSPPNSRFFVKQHSGLHRGASLGQSQLRRPGPVQLVGSRPSLYRPLATASVVVGTKLPEADLSYFDKEGNLQTVTTEQLTKGKKVVLFAVPGAFTPTCSQKHLPGFVEKADELRSKGVDTVACVSVNDPFVMRAWGESSGAAGKVLMLADGSALFTKALGVALDLTDKGLGVRSRRYALLAEDGVVKTINLEEGGAFTVSGPDEILKVLA